MKSKSYLTLVLFAVIALHHQANAQAWNISGNAGTNASTDFLGTTDSKPLRLRTNNAVRMTIGSTGKIGIGTTSPVSSLHIKATTNLSQLVIDAYSKQADSLPLIRLRDAKGNDLMHISSDDATNTFIGLNAGRKNDSTFLSPDGTENTFIGSNAGAGNTTGYSNTAIGTSAMMSNIYGHWNTACGVIALGSNDYGTANAAFGYGTMFYNTSGGNNSAFGFRSMHQNQTGMSNTAFGFQSLFSNTTGNNNCAFGYEALLYNADGLYNTASGFQSLYANSSGDYNTATGYFALRTNSTGNYNTATGTQALYANTSGIGNTGDGLNALYSNTTGGHNTALGYDAMFYNVSGSYNTNIGRQAGCNNGYNPSNFISLGYNAGHLGNNSNTIEIGNNSISWIGGQVGWSTYSDSRIKDNVKSNVPGLAFINKLNPVTYTLNIHRQAEICNAVDSVNWQGKYDIEKIVQTGFIAQEVEQAAKEMNYDFNGVQPPVGNAKLYSIQYASFVVPLVKAVQELDSGSKVQRSEVQKLKEENAKLKNEIAEMKSCLETLCSNSEQTKANSQQLISNSFLNQNNPNPFKENTTIGFYISASSKALLKIFSMNGEEIKSFIISTKGKGQIEIAGNTLAPGVYTYVLIVDDKTVDTKQMVVTR